MEELAAPGAVDYWLYQHKLIDAVRRLGELSTLETLTKEQVEKDEGAAWIKCGANLLDLTDGTKKLERIRVERGFDGMISWVIDQVNNEKLAIVSRIVHELNNDVPGSGTLLLVKPIKKFRFQNSLHIQSPIFKTYKKLMIDNMYQGSPFHVITLGHLSLITGKKNTVCYLGVPALLRGKPVVIPFTDLIYNFKVA